MKEFKKKCPVCGKEQYYCSKYVLRYAIRDNLKCYSCTSSGRIPWNVNRKMSDEFKKECSIGIKKKYRTGWSPRVGKIHSEQARETMSKSHKGKQLTEHHKQLISKSIAGSNNPFYGKHHTDEWKCKKRIQLLNRFELLGIGNNEDVGAKEWFLQYNKENNTNFVPKKFNEIGYWADGYDENLHAWIEYDTPMHNSVKQKQKDLIRQNNIIKYFMSVNNPLKMFIRIKVDKNRNVTDITHVL